MLADSDSNGLFQKTFFGRGVERFLRFLPRNNMYPNICESVCSGTDNPPLSHLMSGLCSEQTAAARTGPETHTHGGTRSQTCTKNPRRAL